MELQPDKKGQASLNQETCRFVQQKYLPLKDTRHHSQTVINGAGIQTDALKQETIWAVHVTARQNISKNLQTHARLKQLAKSNLCYPYEHKRFVIFVTFPLHDHEIAGYDWNRQKFFETWSIQWRRDKPLRQTRFLEI